MVYLTLKVVLQGAENNWKYRDIAPLTLCLDLSYIFNLKRILYFFFFLYFFPVGGCSLLKCPMYAVCHNAPDGSPTCVCPRKDVCLPVIRTVCGTDGKTYINECLMKVIACEKRQDIEKRKDGLCGKTTSPSIQ